MLTLGDSRLGDVHRYLTTVLRAEQLRETSPGIDIHLQREGHLLFRKIGEVGRIELLGKTVLRDLGNDERRGLIVERMQQVDNLTKRCMVRRRNSAVTTFGGQAGLYPFELTVMLFTLQGCDHLIYQVVDVEQLQLDCRIVDLDRQIVGDVVAEGCYSGVVVRAAPFAEKIRESVDQHFGSRLVSIVEEEFFAGLLALAVIAFSVTPYQGRLNR